MARAAVGAAAEPAAVVVQLALVQPAPVVVLLRLEQADLAAVVAAAAAT